MSTRKIYVHEGESVEIRVVPPDYGLNASEWEMSKLRPTKYIAAFYENGIDVPCEHNFWFSKYKKRFV